jgi:hypothetical protein
MLGRRMPRRPRAVNLPLFYFSIVSRGCSHLRDRGAVVTLRKLFLVLR